MVNEITADIGLKTKLFTVKGTADNIDSIDSLMVETGQENSFACVLFSFFFFINLFAIFFVIFPMRLLSFQLYQIGRCIFTYGFDCLLFWLNRIAQIDLHFECIFQLFIRQSDCPISIVDA